MKLEVDLFWIVEVIVIGMLYRPCPALRPPFSGQASEPSLLPVLQAKLGHSG